MNKIFIILKRLNEVFIKQRVLLICLVIQNVTLALMMLIYANVIISNGMISGELDYGRIRMFYTFAIISLFLIVCIFAPMLSSRTLSELYNNNTIDHLLSMKIGISDIVYAVFLRALSTLMIILISSFPIISVSFYFGGFSIIKILRLLIYIMSFATFITAVCVFISTIIFDANASIVISYVVSLILALTNVFYISRFLSSTLFTLLYVILNAILVLVLVSISRKTKIFNT